VQENLADVDGNLTEQLAWLIPKVLLSPFFNDLAKMQESVLGAGDPPLVSPLESVRNFLQVVVL